jgi:hypothetical protein
LSEILCKALESEQRAHKATKATLAQYMSQNSALEGQLVQAKRQISSLNVTVKNLGAIIKHNASKQSSEESKSVSRANSSEDTEEAALREFYREYNDLKKLMAPGQRCAANGEPLRGDARTSSNAVETATAKVVDDAQLYNLELLQKPDGDNSADSILRRTLRKHFSLDSAADDGQVLATPSQTRRNFSQLIDISPESVEAGRGRDNPHPATHGKAENPITGLANHRASDKVNCTDSSQDVTNSVYRSVCVTSSNVEHR